MAYQFDSRVRYSETDQDRKLTLGSLIDYFQDCSTFQSEECGCSLDFYRARDCVWMVLSWQIDIIRRPVMGERITAVTWPYDFKAFYGYRNFALLDGDGQYLAKANSVWVLLGISSGRPVKVEPELISGFVPEPRLEMEYASRKIRMPKENARMEAFFVGRQHIDANRHVNNGQYVSMAQEYLPADFETARLHVEYRHQARLHDQILPLVSRQEDAVTVSLCDSSEDPYAIVRFERRTGHLTDTGR